MTSTQALSPPEHLPGKPRRLDLPPRRLLASAGWAVLLVVAFTLLDLWSARLWPDASAVKPWNPQIGLAVAAICAGGMRYALPVFIAAWICEVVLHASVQSTGAHAAAALAVTMGAVGTGMFMRHRHFHRALVSLAAVRDFLVIATAGAAISAMLYVLVIEATRETATASFYSDLLHKWLGDLSGIVVFTPFLLALSAFAVHRRTQRQAPVLADLVGFLLALGAVALLLYVVDSHASERLLYLLFVPLIMLAMRRGLPLATFGIVMAQGVVLGMLWLGGDDADLRAHQVLMLALGSTTLLLAAVAGERRFMLTELARRSAELSGQQHALSNAMRFSAASQTAATLAHELSQPLSAIGTYARAGLEMLDRGTSSRAELRTVIESIAGETARTRESVQRIREFFRTGAIHREPVDLDSVIADVADSVRDRMRDSGIALTTSVEPNLPTVIADRLNVATILHNLVANAADAAADATAPKWIRVVARARIGVVDVEVSDSGNGIDPSLSDALFEPLTTTKATGMGLGLSISRTLANAHGGRLELVAGNPTTFRFSLPIHGHTAH